VAPIAGLASDSRGVDALRASAARDPKAAIREAAKQFEALFMQQLMKSMRQASLGSGMLDNSGSQLGTEMLDTQFSAKMAGLPGGLSDVIARHLERQLGAAMAPADASADGPADGAADRPALDSDSRGPAAGPAAATLGGSRPAHGATPRTGELSPNQAGFVQQHASAARAAQASSGIPAGFMVAQAAHETGWGRGEIRNADGSASHNLFGIKAGAHWKGAVAEVTTTEVIDGEARKVKAKFRAYGSYAESFNDYARLISESPRYAQALAQARTASAGAAAGSAPDVTAQKFALELQRAGYATDPLYAQKLTRTINATLQLQRAVT
jgi:peptidoglycan hydrolase FlgJ